MEEIYEVEVEEPELAVLDHTHTFCAADEDDAEK